MKCPEMAVEREKALDRYIWLGCNDLSGQEVLPSYETSTIAPETMRCSSEAILGEVSRASENSYMSKCMLNLLSHLPQELDRCYC